MRKLYCGGSFCFDYQDNNYIDKAGCDYRAVLLGGCELLLQHSSGVAINSGVTYIGPFYFEADGMTDVDIVRIEAEMIRQCTDAIFLLDDACCPGTISELTLAGTLHKRVHIFYIRRSESEETESSLHTPCWFPIILSQCINTDTHLTECSSNEDAIAKITALVSSRRT